MQSTSSIDKLVIDHLLVLSQKAFRIDAMSDIFRAPITVNQDTGIRTAGSILDPHGYPLQVILLGNPNLGRDPGVDKR